jgi:serine protease AprX
MMFHLCCRLPAIGLIVVLLLFPSFGFAGEHKITPALLQSLERSALSEERVSVIVTLSSPEEVVALAERHGKKQRGALVRELHERARVSQEPLERLLRLRGVADIQSLWLINGLAFEASPALIEELRQLDDVMEIHLNETVEPPAVTPSFAHFSPGWNIDRVNAPDLWNLGYGGAGQVIAVIDTGVDLNHPLLGPRWRGGSNSWFDAFGELDQPADFPDPDPERDVGHGTAVTGLALAGDRLGVAPDAQWIAARIFHPERRTQDSHILAALQWAIDPDGDPGTDDVPQVINGSWGLNAQNVCSDVYRGAIQTLKTTGIAVVFAAGNNGPDFSTSESPANYVESYAVGASDASDQVAGFSARGPSACNQGIYPDVVAPGVFVISTDLGGGLVEVSGTSFAAPHVSGIMVLLMQAFPAASVSDIEAALRGSARDLGVAGPDNVAGYGRVDALAAYNYLGFTPQPILLAPADGELLAGNAVTLEWRQLPDRLGVPVSNQVLLATDASFSNPVEYVVFQVPDDGDSAVVWATGAGLLLALGFAAVLGSRRRFAWRWLAFLVVALLIACSSGGGGEEPGMDETFLRSLPIADLQSNTTYYWKVLAENARGGTSESDVRTFRTP